MGGSLKGILLEGAMQGSSDVGLVYWALGGCVRGSTIWDPLAWGGIPFRDPLGGLLLCGGAF